MLNKLLTYTKDQSFDSAADLQRRCLLKTMLASSIAAAVFPGKILADEAFSSAHGTALGSAVMGVNGNVPGEALNYGDSTGDYILNIVRALTLTGLSEIPYVGGLISALVAVFWPASGGNAWDQVKAQVEAMINQKIDEAVYDIVRDMLIGMGSALQNYLAIVNAGDPILIMSTFTAVNSIFITNAPLFQEPEHATMLLPLFTPFAILHATLLREAVLDSSKMNMTANDLAYFKKFTTDTLNSYCSYIDKTYAIIQSQAATLAQSYAGIYPDNTCKTIQFYITNESARGYQITVLDLRTVLTYYDPTLYPQEQIINLSRTVYQRPIGNGAWCETGSQIYYQPQRTAGLCPPRYFVLRSGGGHGGDHGGGYPGGIVGYEVVYPDGCGPYGDSADPQGRNADADGSITVDNTSTHGPVTGIGYYDYMPGGPNNLDDYVTIMRNYTNAMFVFSLQFGFKDNSVSYMAGGCNSGKPVNTWLTVKDHLLVDLVMEGWSGPFGGVGCIIPGFQLENMGHSNDPTMLKKLLYISSHTELSAETLDARIGTYLRKVQSKLGILHLSGADRAEDTAANIDAWRSDRRLFQESILQAGKKSLSH